MKLVNVITIDPTEDQIQIAVAKWLDTRGVLWCHVANERRTSKRQGAILKRKGVKRGVPDILIFTNPPSRKDKIGTAIELKRDKKSKMTKYQKQWLQDLADNDWLSVCCYGYEDAIETLIKAGY